jgi:Surface adhesin CshA non-repetitive domain 2
MPFRRMRWLFVRLAALCALLVASPALAASCSQATSQGTAPPAWQTYCWLDFTSYNDTTARTAAGQNFSYTLSDGAILTFNVKTSTTAPAMISITAPSWTGAAVGNTAFLGIPGKPILYQQAGGTTVLTFSNILITPPPGAPAVTAYAFVAADAESTNNGESLAFTTNGTGWTILDQVDPISGTLYPTIAGTGTATFTETGVAGTVGGYIVGSNSPTTVTTTLVGGGLQGAMFAVRFASMRLTKVITGARVDPTDQFNFSINATESMAAGSASTLAKYSSRLTCVNGATGTGTLVPTNVATTSYSFGTLAFGDAIQCTFTNAAFPHLKLQKALGTGGRTFNTDQFTMNITSGSTTVATTTTTGTGTTVTTGATPLTQVTAGTAYSLGETSVSLPQYTQAMACTNAATGSTTTLPATVPGTITPQLGDIITCTITNTKKPANATLTVAKVSSVISDPVNGAVNPKAIPGAVVRYFITVTNTGTLAVDTSSIVITDPLPSTVTYNGGSTVTFTNGTPTSGITTFNAATDVRFSNAAAAPSGFAACTYTPLAGYDPAVKHVCIRPTGTMAGATAAGQPNFTVSFLTQIK